MKWRESLLKAKGNQRKPWNALHTDNIGVLGLCGKILVAGTYRSGQSEESRSCSIRARFSWLQRDLLLSRAEPISPLREQL